MKEEKEQEQETQSQETQTQEEQVQEAQSQEAQSVEAQSSPEEEEDVAALKDRLMRALAENENMRKRAQRDILEQRRYAMSEVVQAFLSVADQLDMALGAMEVKSEKSSTASLLTTLHEGVKGTKREFDSILKRFGIEEIKTNETDDFSYELHEAVQEEFHDGLAKGKIVRVLRKGYKIQDKLLRPAMVVVSRGKKEESSAPKQEKQEKSEGNEQSSSSDA